MGATVQNTYTWSLCVDWASSQHGGSIPHSQEPSRSHTAFSNLVSEVMTSHPPCILFFGRKFIRPSMLKGKKNEFYPLMEAMPKNFLGHVLKPPNLSNPLSPKILLNDMLLRHQSISLQTIFLYFQYTSACMFWFIAQRGELSTLETVHALVLVIMCLCGVEHACAGSEGTGACAIMCMKSCGYSLRTLNCHHKLPC